MAQLSIGDWLYNLYMCKYKLPFRAEHQAHSPTQLLLSTFGSFKTKVIKSFCQKL